MALVAALLAGYLLGSIPTGVLMARWVDRIDLLRTGSGHTGGTNVARATKKTWPGVVTVLLDMLLGAASVLVARLISDSVWAPALAGAAVIVGHNWSILIGFRGGVGLACMAGMLVAQAMLPGIVTGAAFILVWLGLRKLLRHDARATVIALLVIPTSLLLQRQPPHLLASSVLGVLASMAPSLMDWRREYERNEGVLGQIGVNTEVAER